MKRADKCVFEKDYLPLLMRQIIKKVAVIVNKNFLKQKTRALKNPVFLEETMRQTLKSISLLKTQTYALDMIKRKKVKL